MELGSIAEIQLDPINTEHCKTPAFLRCNFSRARDQERTWCNLSSLEVLLQIRVKLRGIRVQGHLPASTRKGLVPAGRTMCWRYSDGV